MGKARLVAVVLGAIGFGLSGCQGTADKAATSGSDNQAAVSATPETVNHWWLSSGQGALTALRSALEPEVGEGGFLAAAKQGCTDLASATSTALKAAAVPGTRAMADWLRAIHAFSAGAHDCQIGFSENNQVLSNKAGEEFNSGTEALAAVQRDLDAQGTPLSILQPLCFASGFQTVSLPSNLDTVCSAA